jgi:hypothetical protein
MFRQVLFLTGGLGLVAGLSVVLAADPSPLAAPRGQAVVRGLSGSCENSPDYLGTASCASSSCHHQTGHRRVVGSEFVTWNSEDPHRKAWETLFSARSERMVRNLYGPAAAPASQTVWCLACHATGEGNMGKAGVEFTLVDAVGCESCHGPAKNWLSAHTKAGFRELPTTEKEKEFGLWNTKDLASRARVCATCHVGNADVPLMQVNHDLIAAGHPRLNFEFSSALAKYPAHWRVDGEQARHPDLGWRAWQVGQVAVAEAVTRLTGSRAAKAAHGGPWPEFAEQDCFSCHKDLSVDSNRAPFRTPLTAGKAPWQTWYAGTMAWADPETEAALAPLRKHMSQSAPDAVKAGALAKVAAEFMARRSLDLAQREPVSIEGQGALLARLAGDTAREAGKLAWEQQAQRYLGLAALREDIRRRAGRFDAAFEKPYLELRDALIGQFPPGHDSPRADSDESRASRDRDTVLRKLESALGGIAGSTR